MFYGIRDGALNSLDNTQIPTCKSGLVQLGRRLIPCFKL